MQLEKQDKKRLKKMQEIYLKRRQERILNKEITDDSIKP